mmetsp:Transcript_16796/g.39517  ORF Transcript_16796/g.39517 Transcript_16796/m.39517 type:complete len:224 (-) Transcript_16796:467-1138(-)
MGMGQTCPTPNSTCRRRCVLLARALGLRLWLQVAFEGHSSLLVLVLRVPDFLRQRHRLQAFLRPSPDQWTETRVHMMCETETGEVPQVGRASLQRSWHDSQSFGTMRPWQKWLICPLLLKLGCHRPHKKVDDGIAEVTILVGVPGTIEKVESTAHIGTEILQERYQSALCQKWRHVGEHHGCAVPGLRPFPATALSRSFLGTRVSTALRRWHGCRCVCPGALI